MSDEISLARGWTLEAYVAHNEAMRAAEAELQKELHASEHALQTERDRRYMELAVEREKALKIKETADLAALGLAREIQTYKDEKANELRSQIESERGSYATKADLVAAVEKLEETIKPIASFITVQQGKNQGVGLSANIAAFLITTIIAMGGLLAIVYIATH